MEDIFLQVSKRG